ncbi:hypothetical protein R3W88_029700 [Solanum pinnatisectum]|uniref:DUF7148 domain-containing protein n=1 Tax=Solanum pinnatisectum TaxID=50273 RepID=A0AAV9K639_9SOLN|nr:hypothetical protein R3W88_029700 [Solanum pinnatisectum]
MHSLKAQTRGKLLVTDKFLGGGDGSISLNDQDYEDGVSLGTMKLPKDIDLAIFETLLFQWANSLCQGAILPLPVPLKVGSSKSKDIEDFTITLPRFVYKTF